MAMVMFELKFKIWIPELEASFSCLHLSQVSSCGKSFAQHWASLTRHEHNSLTINDTGLVRPVRIDPDAAAEVDAVLGHTSLPPTLWAVRFELTGVRCLGGEW